MMSHGNSSEWDDYESDSDDDVPLRTFRLGPPQAKKAAGGFARATAPSKARSAWILYTMDMRAKVMAEDPSMQPKEVLKILGSRWKELPEEDKQVYENKARAERHIEQELQHKLQNKTRELQEKNQELQQKERETKELKKQRDAANVERDAAKKEGDEAKKEVARLRGTGIGRLSAEELQQLRSEQEEGIQRVEKELELREAEDAVAKTNNNLFVCPVSQALMKDPVSAADGYIYERASIEKWIRQQADGRAPRSPSTNLPLQNTRLTPSYTLKSAICQAVDLELGCIARRKRAREGAKGEGDGGESARPASKPRMVKGYLGPGTLEGGADAPG